MHLASLEKMWRKNASSCKDEPPSGAMDEGKYFPSSMHHSSRISHRQLFEAQNVSKTVSEIVSFISTGKMINILEKLIKVLET